MPGGIRKARTVPNRSRSIAKARLVVRSVASRPKVAPRIKTDTTRRSTDIKRAQNRIVKRQAVRQNASQIQPRPRPVVRPASQPLKRMPKVVAPPVSGLKSMRRAVRPADPPGTQPGRAARPGSVALGATAAGALLGLNMARAHPDLLPGLTSFQSILTDIQDRSDFSEIAADVAKLDSDLSHMLNLLESARERGYRYQGDLEDLAYQSMDRWQSVRAQVDSAIPQQSQAFQSSIAGLNPEIQRLNAVIHNSVSASSSFSTAQSHANQVLWDLQKAESALESLYADIESSVHQLNSRLTTIHWALDQLGEAKFTLQNHEELVMAVPARWDQEGKDDPEGILYLTNQRLLFEQKEKVAKKKILFMTMASELVQGLLIEQPLKNLGEITARNQGVFGHQDFLDVAWLSGSPRKVSFHLGGQDSEQWARLIGRAQSGEIENERATGSGLSFQDLTGPLTSADLLALQTEVNELQDEMMLKDIQGELSELENEVSRLDRDLAALRARGYAVEKNIEADVKVLVTQWERVKNRTTATLEYQAKILGAQMAEIQKSLAVLIGLGSNLGAARPRFVQLKSKIASAEAQADAAEDTVLDQYDDYADEVESLSAHFDWVDWMLTALSTASFRLLEGESGVAATEATWERPGLEAENGVLYLTDQRLLWEDRVDAYELKIAAALAQVGSVQQEKTPDGEFEVLLCELSGPNVPVTTARFQLSLPVAEEWMAMIGRARAGDYFQDRAIEIDFAQLERIRNAPEQCPNCGAAFTAPVLRGQQELVCEYCGVLTRI